jgi:inward rectifier potassium channel
MIQFSRQPRRISNNQHASELGFGSKVMTDGRMMNSDGSFNVQRETIGFWDNTYHQLIIMPWALFFLLVFGCFVLLNSLFALLYVVIGIEHLGGVTPGNVLWNFANAYFFSSQTLTTVGYGHISPQGLVTSIVASIESFAGLLAFALISGLLYGRFSRPRAKIVFSEQMLVAPYGKGQALMFRMGHASKSELIETEVQMLIAINQRDETGNLLRNYYPLPLEINKVSFFSLSWTLVHALDERSPVFGFSKQDLADANSEIMVLVKAVEDTNQQMVHARRSYTTNDLVWNARFGPVITRNKKGQPQVLLSQIGAYEED